MGIHGKKSKFAIATVMLAVAAFVCVSLAGQKKHERKLSIGERFHHETSLTWWAVLGDVFGAKPKKPPQYKTYPGVKKVKLPKPEYKGITVEEAIKKRRSVRNYSTKAISKAQLSQLLFAA